VIDGTVGTSGEVVPPWLRRIGALSWRILVVLAAAGVVLFCATLVSNATISILIAIVISATFAPYVQRLRARGWSRTLAAAVVTGVALLVVTVIVVLIVLAFTPYAADVVARIADGVNRLKQSLADLQVPPAVGIAIELAIRFVRGLIDGAVVAIGTALANAVTIAILGGFMTFFLLQDGDKAWSWAMQPAADWQRTRITAGAQEALERVGGYLRGTTILAALHAISDFIFLVLLGVPLAGPLAVLVFVFQYIPYIGGMITTVAMILVTYSSQGLQAVILLLAAIGVMNIIFGNFLGPQVYGRTVDLHPAIVLVALPAGAAVAGMFGLFAAIPIVAFVIAISDSVVAVLQPETPPASRPLAPIWLDRLAQWGWRFLVAIAVLAVALRIMVALPIVVGPIMVAILLAAILADPVSRLRARGWGAGRAAAAGIGVSVLVVAGILVVTVAMLAGPLADVVRTAIAGSGEADGQSGGILGWVVALVQTFGLGILATIARTVASIGSLLVILLIGTLLGFYFLKDGPSGWSRIIERLDTWRRRHVDSAGRKAIGVLGGYLVGTGAISLFSAITQWLIMVILGLPFAFPLAILAFFGGFIPYIGSFITTGLAFLVAFAVGTPQQIAIMGIYTVIFNIVQGNFVAPIVYSRAVSLHPAIVLISIPAAGQVAGVLGMFIVVPLLGVISACWREVLLVFGNAPRAWAMPPEEASADLPAAADLPASADLPAEAAAGPQQVGLPASPTDPRETSPEA
jgi:predicted PurR-regulated permease PerM